MAAEFLERGALLVVDTMANGDEDASVMLAVSVWCLFGLGRCMYCVLQRAKSIPIFSPKSIGWRVSCVRASEKGAEGHSPIIDSGGCLNN